MHRIKLYFVILLSVSAATSACSDQVIVRETEASCGNASIEMGEQCDDGNNINTDACTNACEVARCGDGVARADLGAGEEGYEGCDDGNLEDNDTCTIDCVAAVCGDGIVRVDLSEGMPGFENCDDANDDDDDACRNKLHARTLW